MNFLGIDYGTTSVKAALFDENLHQTVCISKDYTLKIKDDIVEFEADKYWEILKLILENVGLKSKIDALAIDTQCETLILTDADGNPVRDAIVWLDNRATKEAKIIEEYFGREKVYQITGQPEITATWPACKLLWVKNNEPEIWAKTQKIFLLEDYLLYKLTGEFVTEKTLQSSSLYFNIKDGVWWKELLDFIGVEEDKLPRLCGSGEYVGNYKGIKVITSAMDQVAGAIGAGVIEKGIVSEMTGTTMAIFVPTDEIPQYDETSIVPCHYNYDDGYCLLSWSPTAGMALKWFKNAFLSDKSFSELDEMAEKISVGSDGLVFLPYLCGSTMPQYNPDARGSFTGLTPEHTPAHFVRSIMEAVTCMLKSNLDYLNVPVTEIRAMGGGASSHLWCSMKADMTGKNLITLKNKETACLGSAILAGVGYGYFASVKEACKNIKTDKIYTPNGIDYSEVYEKFIEYDSILNIRKEKKYD
jgi:xylulokinase